MSDSESQLYELLAQSREMPYGDHRDAFLEDLLQRTQASEQNEIAYYTRMELVSSYTHGMHPEKVFVPFARCLADYDRNPHRYESWVPRRLRWQFKFIVEAMVKFPEVPLDRALGVLDQMEERYRAERQSLHAVYSFRHRVTSHVGDQAAADHWYEMWCAAPRDQNSDCEGCDPIGKVGHLAARGRDAEAVALAEPVLTGELTCLEQPQSILTELLLPFVRTGELEKARDAHRRAYRVLRSRPQDLATIADHIVFCALTGNEVRGLELLDRHLGWLDTSPSPKDTMWFSAAAALLLRTVTEVGGGDATIVRPAHGDRPSSDVSVAALQAEMSRTAIDLGARFDRRNRTLHQSTLIRELLARQPLVAHLPLSAVAAHRVSPAAGSSNGHTDSATVTATEALQRAEEAYQEAAARFDADDHAAALAAVETALAALPADSTGLLRAAAHALRGELLQTIDRPAEAIGDLLTALALCGPENPMPELRKLLAQAYKSTGQLVDAADAAEEAITQFVAEQRLQQADQCRYLLAGLHNEMGEYEPALALYDEIAKYRRSVGEFGVAAVALNEAAEMLDDINRDAQAAEYFGHAADAAESAGEMGMVVAFRGSAALSLHWNQDFAAAVSALEQAREAMRIFAASKPNPDELAWHQPRLDYKAARVLAGADHPAEALDAATNAAAAFRALGDATSTARADLLRGQLLKQLGS